MELVLLYTIAVEEGLQIGKKENPRTLLLE